MIIGTLACVTTGAARDRRRREHETGDQFHLVVGNQLGDHRLGIGAGRRAFVAFDELDLVGADVLGVQLDVEVERLVDLIAEVGIRSRIGQHHADLDGFRLGGCCPTKRQQ